MTDDRNLFSRQRGDASRIEFMFCRVNALVQSFRRVVVQNRHRRLADDRAGIHSCIHEMHRATGDFHAVIQRLPP